MWPLLLIACSEEIAPVPHEVVSLEVTPAEATVTTGPLGGEAVQFEAWVTLEDGERAPLEVVEWTVSNTSAGEIDAAGLFSPSTSNGGDTWVTARSDGLESTATVKVIYERRIVEEGADPDLFIGSVGDLEDAWLYPEDGVNLPRNTPSVELQWVELAEARCWRLELRSAFTDLTVYTTAASWEADEQLWQTIAATNAGGRVEIELTAATDVGLLQAAPLVVNVNRMDASGSILYWSTSTEGFMEIPYGGDSQEFLTINQTGRCQGCHAVSSRGYLAFTYDGGNGSLGVVDMDGMGEVLAGDGQFFGNFKTFSPDGRYLAAAYGGALLLYDGLTLEYLGEIAVGEPVTHVDWSPDGDRLAMTVHDGGEGWGDWYFSGGRIAVMDYYGDGSFGAPVTVFDPGEGYNAYYPAWSPDGEWIAFNVSTGDSYDDEDAEVWVMSATSGDALPLAAANLGEGLTNSWPRWGPLPDDDILWLAFASKRAYGRYYSAEAPAPQIWVAGFDPQRAAAGRDPSWPAFWLPGQDTAQNNHIPVWAELP
jgi:hypothetical protein